MDYKAGISEYQRDIQKNNAQIFGEYQKIAKAVLEISPPVLESKDYKEFSRQYHEIKTEKTRINQSLSELEHVDEQLEEHKSAIATQEKKKKELQVQLKDLLQTAGHQLFNLYSNAPQQYLQFCPDFVVLDKLFREQFRLEDAVDTSQNTQLFNRLIRHSKKRISEMKIQRIEMQIQSHFVQVAEHVSESWVENQSEDKKIDTILLPIFNQREKILEIDKIILRYKKDLESLQVKQKSIALSKIPEHRYKQLKKQVKVLEDELGELLQRGGELVFKSFQDAPPAKLKSSWIAIEKLTKQNLEYEEMISRFKAAQKLLFLREKIARLQEREARLDQQVETLGKQLKEVHNEIGKIEKDILTQEALRGDETTLGQFRTMHGNP